ESMRKLALTTAMVGLLGYPVVQGQARVVSLAMAASSVTLSNPRVSADSSTGSFTATNAGVKAVRSYAVSIFSFPRAGRHGFATGVQHPSSPIPIGQSHQGSLPISNQVSLTSDTTLIMAVKTVTFDDGTSWTNDDLNSQIDQRARELNLP